MPGLKVKSFSDAIAKVQLIIKRQNTQKVVVGLPLGPNREETQQSIKTRYFVSALKSTNGAEVEFWNESFTSQQALKRVKGGTKRKKKKSPYFKNA